MLKYLTHKLKTQSINEENPNEKVSKIVQSSNSREVFREFREFLQIYPQTKPKVEQKRRKIRNGKNRKKKTFSIRHIKFFVFVFPLIKWFIFASCLCVGGEKSFHIFPSLFYRQIHMHTITNSRPNTTENTKSLFQIVVFVVEICKKGFSFHVSSTLLRKDFFLFFFLYYFSSSWFFLSFRQCKMKVTQHLIYRSFWWYFLCIHVGKFSWRKVNLLLFGEKRKFPFLKIFLLNFLYLIGFISKIVIKSTISMSNTRAYLWN